MLNPSHPDPTQPARDVAVWKALADPSRRQILDLLRSEPRTTGDLAARFEISRYGVMKHLGVLADAGLVLVRRRGRERWNHLNPVPIQEIYRRWLRPFEALGADGLLAIRDLAEQADKETAMPDKDMNDSGNASGLRALDIQMEIAIDASPDTVWRALTDHVVGWWPRDFYIGPKPKGFVLETRVGGRVYEDWGDGPGLLWGTILVFDPGKTLQWAGDLSAEFGGPARSITSFRLRDEGGSTVLAFRDTPFGALSETAEGELAEGWKHLLEGCLKPYAETGTSPERPPSVG